MIRLLLFTCIVFACACTGSGVPNNIIPPDQMKLVLFDMVRADEFANNYIANDTSKNKQQETYVLYEQVFKIHKVDKARFYKSFSYYQQHPDKNKELYDSVNALAARIKTGNTLPKKVKEIKPLKPNE